MAAMLVFELLLGLLGIVHFAIAYTYFPEHVMRAFIIGTLMVLTAIILYVVTEHANRKTQQTNHT